jgi:hypothetical protein
MLRRVIKVEMSCAIAHLLSYGDRLKSEHAQPPGCEVPEHLMARGLERFPPKRHLEPPFGTDFRIPNGILVSEFALTFCVWAGFASGHVGFVPNAGVSHQFRRPCEFVISATELNATRAIPPIL